MCDRSTGLGFSSSGTAGFLSRTSTADKARRTSGDGVIELSPDVTVAPVVEAVWFPPLVVFPLPIDAVGMYTDIVWSDGAMTESTDDNDTPYGLNPTCPGAGLAPFGWADATPAGDGNGIPDATDCAEFGIGESGPIRPTAAAAMNASSASASRRRRLIASACLLGGPRRLLGRLKVHGMSRMAQARHGGPDSSHFTFRTEQESHAFFSRFARARASSLADAPTGLSDGLVPGPPGPPALPGIDVLIGVLGRSMPLWWEWEWECGWG